MQRTILKPIAAASLLILLALGVYWFATSEQPPRVENIVIDTEAAPHEEIRAPDIAPQSPELQTASDKDDLLTEIERAAIDQDSIDRFLEDAPALRYRVVEIDSDRIRQYIRDEDQPLVLNLFDDVRIEVVAKIRNDYAYGDFSGIASLGGAVAGAENRSYVLISIGPDNTVIGEIASGDWTYHIKQVGSPGHHIVWQRDPKAPFRKD